MEEKRTKEALSTSQAFKGKHLRIIRTNECPIDPLRPHSGEHKVGKIVPVGGARWRRYYLWVAVGGEDRTCGWR